MLSKILKLKRNKVLFSLAVFFALVVVFDVAVLLFNVIHFLVINNVASNFSGAFLPMNIVAICLNALCIILMLVYLLLRKLRVVG